MLYITSDRPVRDIQRDFSRAFPFLKIEFFTQEPAARQKIPNEQSLFIKNSLGKTEGKKFLLTPSLTIKELAKTCYELFGVSVRVYRGFNNLWLATSITEHFTLQQQNDHASEIVAQGVQ